MVAADEQAVAERHGLPGSERRQLRGLAVGDRVGPQVGPVVDGRAEHAAQLGADGLLEVGLGNTRAGGRDQGPTGRGVGGGELLCTTTLRAGPRPVPSSTR